MPGTIDARLSELNIQLPAAPTPVANFVPCVRSGNTLYLAGQVSLSAAINYQGKVGREVTVHEAKAAARLCALNALAQAKAFLGDLDRIARVCMVQGFVNASPEFTDHPLVINGASDLFVQLFGDAGTHARFAVGAGSLPFNVAVELAVVLEVTDLSGLGIRDSALGGVIES